MITSVKPLTTGLLKAMYSHHLPSKGKSGFSFGGWGGGVYTGYSVIADGKTGNKIYKHSREPYSYKSNYHSNG